VSGFTLRRIAEAEVVSYGPKSELRVLVGDASGTTPIRTALQTCQPGYDVPFHSHPYVEYLMVIEGSATFRVEGGGADGSGVDTVTAVAGDTVELHPGVFHAFTTSATEVTKLLGIHLSSHRVVDYRSGVRTDARGFRVAEGSEAPVASASD
jgi:quercetin dioxygenase-like cupin family protein